MHAMMMNPSFRINCGKVIININKIMCVLFFRVFVRAEEIFTTNSNIAYLAIGLEDIQLCNMYTQRFNA